MKKCTLSGLFLPVILSTCFSLPAKADNLEEMAQQGDTDAMIVLSYQYLSEETSSGTEKAKYWLWKAAEQGDADADALLGTIYYTEKNYKEAAPLLRQACSNNNKHACSLLHKLKTQ